MSPVIYRPAGSGPDRDPEHDPEQPPRVPIAGPGIPTAASFADDTESSSAAPPDPDEPVDLDDHPAPAAPAPSRRPSLQRRRRRILGRSHDAPEPEEPRPSDVPPPDESTEDLAATPPKRIEELADESDHLAPPRPRRVRTLHIGAPPMGPADEPAAEDTEDPVLEDDTEDPVAENPVAEESPADASPIEQGGTANVSGHVLSTRGRGLSGIALVVIDPDDQVVGTAVTGRRGQFVIEQLSRGTYRIGARDAVDGDFVDSWHGDDQAAHATELHLEDGGALTDVDITVTGRVAIDATVDVRPTGTVVDIEIHDRSTGLPGEGAITVSTDQFRAQLPLTDGRASITLFGSPRDEDSGAAPSTSRLRVGYPGSQHSSPATRTIRLR